MIAKFWMSVAGGMLIGLLLGAGIGFFRVWHDYCLIPGLAG